MGICEQESLLVELQKATNQPTNQKQIVVLHRLQLASKTIDSLMSVRILCSASFVNEDWKSFSSCLKLKGDDE